MHIENNGQAAARERRRRGSATEFLQQAALELNKRGLKPTVDLLIQECGGSRTTATQALNAYWKDRLPAYLDVVGLPEIVPEPILLLMLGLWREAQRESTAIAEDAVEEKLRAAESELHHLLKERDAIASERAAYEETHCRLREMQAAATEAEKSWAEERSVMSSDLEQARNDLQIAIANLKLTEQVAERSHLENESALNAAAEENMQLRNKLSKLQLDSQAALARLRGVYEARIDAMGQAQAEALKTLSDAFKQSQ